MRTKIPATLFIAFIIYANLATMLTPVSRRHGPVPSLRIEATIKDFFWVFGVFSYYETFNRDVLIEGRTTELRDGRLYYKSVPIDHSPFFPFKRGEQHTRLWAERSIGSLPTMPHADAQRFMAQRIRERYNRDHPAQPIDKIRIVHLTWPRSRQGYYVEKKPDAIQRTYWLHE
jgi:hypothetical protein